MKEDIEILQAHDKGYNMLVINVGYNAQDACIYDDKGKIIGQIGCSRREKNKLLGMKVVNDKIEIYAESKSDSGDKYYYKLIFSKKLKPFERPPYYNLSGL